MENKSIDTVCEDINLLFGESRNRDVDMFDLVIIYLQASHEYKQIHPLESITINSVRRPYAMAKTRDYVWFNEDSIINEVKKNV